ncbi:MAG: hypothetical protein AAF587_41640 [Bacteroidota bacterium]
MNSLISCIPLLLIGLHLFCGCGSSASTKPDQQAPPDKESTCLEDEQRLVKNVREIAARMEAEQLMYGELPLTDCSGIFHRLLDSLKERCPEAKYPSKSYRSSRALAQWYHEQGSLVLLPQPETRTELIRPGAVLFYGGRGDQLAEDDFTIGHLTSSEGINHVGIVTTIKRNSSGVVETYKLFHGLRPGKFAKTTSYHSLNPSRDTYPPLGNGKEALVAIAPVVSQ